MNTEQLIESLGNLFEYYYVLKATGLSQTSSSNWLKAREEAALLELLNLDPVEESLSLTEIVNQELIESLERERLESLEQSFGNRYTCDPDDDLPF